MRDSQAFLTYLRVVKALKSITKILKKYFLLVHWYTNTELIGTFFKNTLPTGDPIKPEVLDMKNYLVKGHLGELCWLLTKRLVSNMQ